MLKLDKKDKMLLYELSRNARDSHTQLGKKVQLSKSSVKYRIERLKQLGVIEKFTAVINIGATGSDTAVILIRFNEHLTDEIKNYFRTQPSSNWAITMSGQWDVLSEVAFKSLEDLKKIIDDMLQNFSGKINSYEVILSSRALRVEHLVKDFYKELNIESIEQKPRAVFKHEEIDDTDKKILKTISQDSEQSILDIAKKTDKTVDTVKSRMKKLIECGIIIKFFTEINLKKLDYTEYLYKIKLNNLNQEKIKSLAHSIKINDNVKYAFLDLTGTNLIINFAFKKAEDIDEFTSEIRKKYHEIIDTQEYYLIKEQLKFDLFPESINE